MHNNLINSTNNIINNIFTKKVVNYYITLAFVILIMQYIYSI